MWIRNQHPSETVRTIFQTTQRTLNFWDKFAQKWILDSKYEKSKSRFGISTLKIICLAISRQKRKVWTFGLNFARKWILGLEFQKSKSRFGISILEILHAPIFRQNGQLSIFGPEFAQKLTLSSKYQKSKIRTQHPWDTMINSFKTKETTLNFWA